MFTDGMSRLAVGVSLMVALSLALFLTIAVLLLADLFCSHLRERRIRRAEEEASRWRRAKRGLAADDEDAASSVATATTAREAALSSTPPFYYAHGVMQAADTKDILLAIPKLESAVWRWSPARRSSPSSSSSSIDRFVCISNPVYERGAAAAAGGGGGGDTPPFETPDASPSPAGITEEMEEGGEFSPPLSVMRKLPPLGVVACPPPAMGFVGGRPSLTAWSGTVTDTNRASSSSSNLTAHFFSSWSPK
uniref:Uncharacterized protein n=1 Tax=Leersia perrieri TaxID=77586 RepID=A0A0D9WAC3_9ORYZ